MFTSSRYLMAVTPTRCAFCNQPFRLRDGFLEFWRTSDGHHYCSEFCADDAEEAQFCMHHSSTISRPTTTRNVQLLTYQR